MDRQYKAFISYRHLPLDMWTAKKLHKRIEHYVIPKDLRKNGEKKIGYVFRDQDELPISSNLNENIQEALDRSQFLIVICTPETVKSRWVLGEIDYFLEHHSRDHVLAVLADGTPETAFPPQLTENRDAEGNPLEQIEPLAANIIADSKAKRAKLFRTESLRILAALIGCPYDALYRRDVRYRVRRTAVIMDVGFTVAAIFIAMLVNKNAQINRQLMLTQINESRALAALSKTAYREGNYNASVRYAMEALPREEEERPFVAEAEKALSSALGLYQQGDLSYLQSVEQESDIVALTLSDDGELLATLDLSGCIRCYDADSGELLWKKTNEKTIALQFLPSSHGLLVSGLNGTALYAVEDGTLLWEKMDLIAIDILAFYQDSGILLAVRYGETPGAEAEEIRIIDAVSGDELHHFDLPEQNATLCPTGALSASGEEAALLLQPAGKSTADLVLFDLSSGTAQVFAEDLHFSVGATSYRLAFTPAGDLALACDDMNGISFIRLFRRKDNWKCAFETTLETEKIAQAVNSSVSWFSSVDIFYCWEDKAVFGSKHMLCMLSLDTGEILWQRTLPGSLLYALPYNNECLSLVMSNGTITYCTDIGTLAHTQNMWSFQGGFGVSLATAQGKNHQEGTFVLVPDAAPQRAALLRFLDLDGMVPVAGRSTKGNRLCLIPSPSRQQIACVEYDAVGKAVQWSLLDTVEGSTSEPQPIPDGLDLDDLSRVLLSDNGELSISDDTSNLLMYELTGKDGTPLKISFTRNGEVSVTDEKRGEELFSSRFREQTISLTAKGIRTDALFSSDGSRLILIYDDPTAAEPVCIVLDTGSWECIGIFDGVAAYLPGRDSVLVTPYLDDVYLSPFWNLREIQAKALEILGGEVQASS